MEEALRRMEAGEDPEKIEEQMGDVFEEDPLGGLLGGEGAEERCAGDSSRSKKEASAGCAACCPPSHDPELHEM